MKTLILIFITTTCAFGQISPSESLDFNSNDLVTEYVIFWDMTRGSALGENIELKKNHKFDYSVFTIGDGVGYVEKSLATGRYKIKGDTLRIIIKQKSNSIDRADVFSLRPYYLIRTTNRRDNENKKYKTLICLVPGDKVGTWDKAAATYHNISVDKRPEGQFWKENIFTDQK